MGGCSEEVFDEVVFVLTGADHTLAAALLGAIFVERGAFHEALVRDGDHATFVWNDVFHTEVAINREDLGAAWIAVFLLHLNEFFLDDF